MKKSRNRLTDDQRNEIKSAAKDVTNAELAKKFGISQNTVNYHRSGGSAQRAPATKQAAERKGAVRNPVSIDDVRTVLGWSKLTDAAKIAVLTTLVA